MALDFFDIEWAKKRNGSRTAYAEDVYIAIASRQRKKGIYISFRNSKLPSEIEYLQIGRLGHLLLFKESDSVNGWKLKKAQSLTLTRCIEPSESVIGKEIAELVKAHNHEGFDLQYDAKSKVYYVDTSRSKPI